MLQSLPEWLNFFGRLLMSAYFLWAVYFNLGSRAEHVSHIRAMGFPFPNICFTMGMAAQFVGGLGLLFSVTAPFAGVILIAFTVTADFTYHRFWLIIDPGERTRQKLVLYEHAAFCGGLLGLISLHL